ncbi:hypothetical protein NEOKW01_1666 [Nematocida sp. AWRm80]|nr:hypothetical protein NEOKW01_1666 [Nematocida sp. AWRm80]
MVERNPSKVKTRVRFPVSASFFYLRYLKKKFILHMFSSLSTLSPEELYKRLKIEEQQNNPEEIKILSNRIKESIDTSVNKYSLYSVIELLRVGAPLNPFTATEIEKALNYLMHQGTKEIEGRRVLEIFSTYKMISLVNSPILVNTVLIESLKHTTKKWAIEMIRSILEEKEEEIGKEAKELIVNKILEGTTELEYAIEKYFLLFKTTVAEMIRTRPDKIVLIRKLNEINKNIVPKEIFSEALEEATDKKSFILFVNECVVRKEVLLALEKVSEDRSPWIRTKVPLTLLRKSFDPYYSTVVAAEIRSIAVELFSRRMVDPMSQVRHTILDQIQPEYLQYIPEFIPSLLERILDKNPGVSQIAQQLSIRRLKEEFETEYKLHSINPSRCILCSLPDTHNANTKENLSTIHSNYSTLEEIKDSFTKSDYKILSCIPKLFTEEEDTNVTTIRKSLLELSNNDTSLIQRMIIRQVYHYCSTNPEEISGLFMVLIGISLLRIFSPEDRETISSCDKHTLFYNMVVYLIQNTHWIHPNCHSTPNDNILSKITEDILTTIRNSNPKDIYSTVPISLLVLFSGVYSKSTIPKEVLEVLVSRVNNLSNGILQYILRLLIITRNTNLLDSKYITGIISEYIRLRTLCIEESNTYSRSISISNLSINNISNHISTSNQIEIEEMDIPLDIVISLQLDLLEIGIRSLSLEKYLLSTILSKYTYASLEIFNGNILLSNRLISEIRPIFYSDSTIHDYIALLSIILAEGEDFIRTNDSFSEVLTLLLWWLVESSSSRSTEIFLALFKYNPKYSTLLLSFIINLKRIKVTDKDKLLYLYILSEEVQAALEKEILRTGNNPLSYIQDISLSIYQRLKDKEGWASTLILLDDNQYSSNTLTKFKK